MGAKGSSALRGLALAGLLGALPGCGLFSDAKLSDMVPGGNIHTGQLECWLTIEFTGETAGDPRDVVVEFDGIVLPQSQRFDWEFIATRDRIPLGMMKGFAPNKQTEPDGVPPRNVPIKVKYPLQALQMVDLSPGQALKLRATLYWGGEKQGSVTRSVEHVYSRG